MPPRRTTAVGLQDARELRARQTACEARLWAQLRGHRLRGVGFRRQHAIGPYVVDFCAPRHRLIIELDGSPHLQQKDGDAIRTAYLVSQGYRVLRFWNGDVMNGPESVTAAIVEALRLT